MASEKQNADSPHAARKRARDARTVSQMVAIYCAGNHAGRERDERSFAGEPICVECARLDAYAVKRTRECRRMEVKTSCDRCPVHCYSPKELERIRCVMRYAGPRMLFHHPIAGVRHLLGI